jgi:hypothetical protein
VALAWTFDAAAPLRFLDAAVLTAAGITWWADVVMTMVSGYLLVRMLFRRR